MASDCDTKSVLQDVVAFVEVWSSNKTENYSVSFIQQLLDMGAKVLKFFNKQVTHVVFKDGHQSVWKKAKKTGVKLVSVLWVERCLATGSHVDESLFPAINESVSLPGIKSKYRCMRPKDFLEKTPENDKRLRKKLDQMIQSLDLKKNDGAQLPMLSFDEDDADVQSPKLKQYSLDHLFGMAERLKQMKEKRENLSPTASQMSQMTSSADSLSRPSLGESPSISPKTLFKEQHGADSENVSFCVPCGSPKQKIETAICEGQKVEHPMPVSGVNSTSLFSSKSSFNNRIPSTMSTLKFQVPKKKDTIASSSCEEMTIGSIHVKTKEKSAEESTAALNYVTTDQSCNTVCNLTPSFANVKNVELALTAPTDDDFKGSSLLNAHFKNKSSQWIPSPSWLKKNLSDSVKKGQLCKNTFDNLKPIGKDIFNAKQSPVNLYHTSPSREDVAFEDFFSPANLKGQRNQKRLSLNLLPPKSPSPSRLFPKVEKQKRKSQSGSTATRKRARTVSVSSPAAQHTGRTYNGSECVKSSEHINNCDEDTDACQPPIASLNFQEKSRKTRMVELLKTFLDQSEDLTDIGKESEKKNGIVYQDSDKQKVVFSLKDTAPTNLYEQVKEMTTVSKLHSETKNSSLNSLKVTDQVNGNQREKQFNKVQCQEQDRLSKDILILESSHEENEDKHRSPSIQNNHERQCITKSINKQCNGTPKRKGKNKKPTRTLVMTSMPSEKQMIIIQILGQLGGFLFSDVVCETTTHVVAGQPCRTINILLGIARGCWILSFDWILWSLEHGCWVPEEQYELSDKFPAAAICRLEKQLSGGQYQHNLFVNQPLIFISPRSDPPASKLKELVLLCGGKVCKALRQAGMCIGEYRGRRYPGSPYLSEKWILDCITQHRLIPFKDYTLGQDAVAETAAESGGLFKSSCLVKSGPSTQQFAGWDSSTRNLSQDAFR
ncbi:microcephalin [Callorhinchus milii]|uniref:microcephalin n=1 Tax=Callorhinchus milii TaxID=7868 RepID=UPI000457518B|nr:microcephalin [Callorhinchus milii]|eukprot:gi/632953113/ref/XP_007892228.1/ PREDICTED: microcephalin [Callorhinchus milii]